MAAPPGDEPHLLGNCRRVVQTSKCATLQCNVRRGAGTGEDSAVTATVADTLSMLGLVAGFPLLLLCFMLSLEKLESWGLREDAPGSHHTPDRVDAAVQQVEQLKETQQIPPAATVDVGHAVTASRASGRSDAV